MVTFLGRDGHRLTNLANLKYWGDAFCNYWGDGVQLLGVIYTPHPPPVSAPLDINIDLLKERDEFESTFYSCNIIPTIFRATHEKPKCNPPLIDNIFNSGILENKMSHHSPMFYELLLPPDVDVKTKCPKYVYCVSKVSNGNNINCF